MGPEIFTHIGSILRAMENVVLPAINPDNNLAQEQSHIIMVYLRLMADQHDKIFHFRLEEIREYHALVTDILRIHAAIDTFNNGDHDGAIASAKKALDAAAPLLALELPGYEQLAATTKTLREIADELVRAITTGVGSEKAIAAGLSQLLLAQANSEALRERSWVAKLGADPQPAALRPLSEFVPSNAG